MTPAEFLAVLSEEEKRELVALLVANPENDRRIVDEQHGTQARRTLRETANVSNFQQ